MKASQVLIELVQSIQNKDLASSTDSDILRQDSLIAFLTLIDPRHFQSVNLTTSLYWSCLHSMDSYLAQHFSMRVQRNHKLFMAEKRPRNQLVALALFLALKAPLMEELVSVIETIEEETQTMIIELLKRLEPNIQDLQKERNLEQRIQELQVENHCLDGLIEQALDEFNALKQELDILEKQLTLKARKQKELKDEKIALLEKIGIDQCAQYSAILQDAYDQQKRLERINQNILQSIQDSQETQMELFQSVRENTIEISFLQQLKHEYLEKMPKCSLNYHKDVASHKMIACQQTYQQKLNQAQKQIMELNLARSQLNHDNKMLQRLIKKKNSQLQQASRICQIISS